MFKKIQKYLLIEQPLLWNTKIVPLTALLLVLHVIFFVLGYFNGTIDFSETDTNYRSNSNEVILFFSILISIITLIIWLVFYFKNNAFKSFYPKNNFSLFKEWLLILLACFLICGFSVSFSYGKEVKIRSYFTKEEAIKRCQTLTFASLFIDGSYTQNEFQDIDSAGVFVNKKMDHIVYKGKKYPLSSLLNKNVENFIFFGQKEDSLHKIRIKDWLVNNQKDSVKSVFKSFLAIAKEHQLDANINEDQWLELVYNYPDFEVNKIVGNNEKENYYTSEVVESYEYETKATNAIDTVNQYIKTIKNERYVCNKYYVPAEALNYSYTKIASSWVSPAVDLQALFVLFCVALALSIVLFSFRISTGRNWLIALISVGVINILFGIVGAICSNGKIYLSAVAILIFVLFMYFILITNGKTGKGISGITLNALLWLFPAFVPIIYSLTIEILKLSSGYYQADYLTKTKQFPMINALDDNYALMFCGNAVFVVIAMLFFSIKIKKWKGIPES